MLFNWAISVCGWTYLGSGGVPWAARWGTMQVTPSQLPCIEVNREQREGKVDQEATFQIIWDAFWNLTKIRLALLSRKPHGARSTVGSSSEETDVSHGIRMLPCPCTNPVSFSWRAEKSTNKATGTRQGKQQASHVRERKKALSLCKDFRAVCRCWWIKEWWSPDVPGSPHR